MKYFGLWVTIDGVKTIDKKYKQQKYEATYLSKRSMAVYRCSELLPEYVGNTLT